MQLVAFIEQAIDSSITFNFQLLVQLICYQYTLHKLLGEFKFESPPHLDMETRTQIRLLFKILFLIMSFGVFVQLTTKIYIIRNFLLFLWDIKALGLRLEGLWALKPNTSRKKYQSNSLIELPLLYKMAACSLVHLRPPLSFEKLGTIYTNLDYVLECASNYNIYGTPLTIGGSHLL